MNKGLVLDENAQKIVKYYLPEKKDVDCLADFFSVFCDSTRLRMLSALCVTEMCVSDLSFTLELNQSTVSHTLKFLKQYNMVKSRRDGKIIFYSAMTKCVDEVMNVGLNYVRDSN